MVLTKGGSPNWSHSCVVGRITRALHLFKVMHIPPYYQEPLKYIGNLVDVLRNDKASFSHIVFSSNLFVALGEILGGEESEAMDVGNMNKFIFFSSVTMELQLLSMYGHSWLPTADEMAPLLAKFNKRSYQEQLS